MCIDHPEVQALSPQLEDRQIITYGFSRQADVRAVNVAADTEGLRFDVEIAERASAPLRRLEALALPMFGRHNAQNALAAVAIALEMGVAEDRIRAGLAGFRGVNRRFTRTGEAGGITVVDDYGARKSTRLNSSH